MARKLLGQLLFFAAFVLALGCTRKTEKPSRITIQFPQADSSLQIQRNVSAFSTKWQLSDPASSSQINCYAVAVEAADFAGAANRCADLSDTALASPHFIAGTFPAGSTQTLEVPSGSKRRIYLIGFQTDDVTKCVPVTAAGSGLDGSHFSAPYILAQTVIDLSPGDVNVYLNVPSTLPAAGKFEDCLPFAFSRSTATVPLAITSVSPNLSTPGGGGTLTLTGSGFTAGTTVTIGGTACTSAVVVTSTTMTCTIPSGSLGAHDVVATSGVEVATLTNGFTYANLPTLTISDVTVGEGGTTATVAVTLSAAASGSPVTFNYATSDATAQAGSDYTATSGSGSIAVGTSTTNINIPVTSDSLDEDDETITVTLSSISGNATFADAIGLVTVTDDDAAPAIDFSASSQSLSENVGPVTVTVSLAAASGKTVSVDYAVSGTATGGTIDHDLAAGTVVFVAGDTSENITFNVVDDGALEPAETVVLTLSNPTNGTVGGTNIHTVTVNDNETPAVLAISDAGYDFGTLATGASADYTFTVSNSGTVTATSMAGSGLAAPFTFKGGAYPGTGGDCPGTLAGGDTCTIVVTYAPASNGLHSDTINLNYNDGTGAQNATNTINGTGAAPAVLTITDGPTYDFGNVENGSSSDYSFTVTNTGAVAATAINEIGLTAPYSFGGGFPGTGGDCGATLAGGNSCTIVVTFAPTAFGNFLDTIELDYNDGVTGQTATRGVTGDGVMIPVVTAAYPANGAGWFDHVVADGSTEFNASGAACAGTENGFAACVHAGEIRKLTATGFAACPVTLTAADSLNLFDWNCEVQGGTARFFSKLKPGYGLRDLINGSLTWTTNTVTVYDNGTPLGTSSPAAWWSTAIAALPDNSGSATVSTLNPGVPTVYVLNASRASFGYSITAPKTGIVTLPGVTLSWNDQPGYSCNLANATTTSPNHRCLIFGNAQHYLWIEADLNGGAGSLTNPGQVGTVLFGSNFSKIVNTNVRDIDDPGSGLTLTNVKSSTVRNLEVRYAGMPVEVLNSTYNLFIDFRLAMGLTFAGSLLDIAANSQYNTFILGKITGHSGGNGIYIPYGSNNVFQQITISNIDGSGGSGNLIKLQGSNVRGNKFTSLLLSNCGDAAIHLAGVTTSGLGNIFNHVTAANCVWNGVYSIGSVANGVNQLAAMNFDAAVHADTGTTGLLLSQVAISQAGSYNLATETGTELIASGNLLVPGAPSCGIAGSGVGAGCVPADSSSFNLVTGIDLAASFPGKIVVDDSLNADDVSGYKSTVGIATDFFNFFSPFRLWGKDNAAAWPSTSFQGAASAGPLRIFDFSVLASDSYILNRSGNGSTPNTTFTNGSACPLAVDSDTQYEIWFSQTFLRNAVEIVDKIGDNDGLCESNEACLYSPNFGYYQGSGNWTGNQCTFNNGAVGIGVDDVQMYAFPTNGEPPP